MDSLAQITLLPLYEPSSFSRRPRLPSQPETAEPANGTGDSESENASHLLDQPAATDRSSGTSLSSQQQEELPPDYVPVVLRSIATNMIFTFKPSPSSNVMLLIPPRGTQPNDPIMNISVVLNCFNPGSFITTLRSGASPESGKFIGEFEMGDSKAEATVSIGQEQKALDVVFTKWKPSVSNNHVYGWHFLGRSILKQQLVWNQDDLTFTCKQGTMNQSTGDAIAIFRTNPLAAPINGRRRRPPTIEIWPQAFNNPTMLTNVIMSALIIERKRLAS